MASYCVWVCSVAGQTCKDRGRISAWHCLERPPKSPTSIADKELKINLWQNAHVCVGHVSEFSLI